MAHLAKFRPLHAGLADVKNQLAGIAAQLEQREYVRRNSICI